LTLDKIDMGGQKGDDIKMPLLIFYPEKFWNELVSKLLL
jgi:hypothetical protein